MTWLEVIDKEIENLQIRLAKQAARSRVLIPSLRECSRVFHSMENLEVQIETLVRIKGALLANIAERSDAVSRDTITVGNLTQLGKAVREPNLTTLNWKRAVKEFATNHGLTDREAIDLAKIARENF